METENTQPDRVEWSLARGLVEEFLPRSLWREELLQVEKGEPGVLELAPDGRRRYWFHRCRARVRRLDDGREAAGFYSFVFDWREGRWQAVHVPAVWG